jgi:hypothetical protein
MIEVWKSEANTEGLADIQIRIDDSKVTFPEIDGAPDVFIGKVGNTSVTAIAYMLAGELLSRGCTLQYTVANGNLGLKFPEHNPMYDNMEYTGATVQHDFKESAVEEAVRMLIEDMKAAGPEAYDVYLIPYLQATKRCALCCKRKDELSLASWHGINMATHTQCKTALQDILWEFLRLGYTVQRIHGSAPDCILKHVSGAYFQLNYNNNK